MRTPPRHLLRRASTTLALALLLPLLPVPTGASAADPVQVAEREVAAMRAEVERTAGQLTAGTRRLEREQAELGEVERRLADARRTADEADARSERARTELKAVVGAAYRSPLPSGVVLALSSAPDAFGDAVAAQADLARVRGR
ncbi:MAG: hypothetical protein JWN08_3583, partial [Frankiales bacterium]|nr:hypothetical protein [Frankiales bacterium]